MDLGSNFPTSKWLGVSNLRLFVTCFWHREGAQHNNKFRGRQASLNPSDHTHGRQASLNKLSWLVKTRNFLFLSDCMHAQRQLLYLVDVLGRCLHLLTIPC